MSGINKDYLTGLLNRQGLYEWYEELSGEGFLQFMFMDLDNFKCVNDTYGHNVGDELLKAVAKILKAYQEKAVCARLGGDEFVLVVYEECVRDDMERIAEEIIDRIQKKEGFEQIATDVSASIGILLNESKKDALNEVLFKIDTAMYQAKAKGKACYIVFNDIAGRVFDEVQMEKRQREALRKNEFEVYYYPVVSAQTSKLYVSEVFMVWNQPDGVQRKQSEFLPVFERNGFVTKLNIWTLKKVCRHIQKYHRIKGLMGKAAVPVSKLLLLDSNLPKLLQEIVTQYGVSPKELVLEIEEPSFTRGSGEMVQMLQCLKKQGYGIAITEVGVDFASLRYWDKMEIDYIKLSAEYLKGAMSNLKGRQIVKTLLAMGHDLKMQVVADGIAEKEDVLFLSGCGCNAISGAFYSEPLSCKPYWEYVEDKIAMGEQMTTFSFLGDLKSLDGSFEGKVIGEEVEFVPGITKNWGAIKLVGGNPGENVVELPGNILAADSYTIGVWLNPASLNAWTSAVYARYLGGFLSFVPYAGAGNSIFRVNEDAVANGYHDVHGRQIQEGKWFFVCLTFDAVAGVTRYYINGRKIGYLVDVPSLPCCKQILLGGDPFQNSYEGLLSGLVFFDNVKSEEQVEVLYEQFLQEEGFQGEVEDFWLEKRDA